MHPAVFFSIDLVLGCLGQVVYESKTYRTSFILSSGRTRLTLLRAALGYARKRFLLHSCQPLFQLVPLLSYFFLFPCVPSAQSDGKVTPGNVPDSKAFSFS